MNKITAAGKIVSCVMSGFLFTGLFVTEVAAGECDQIVSDLSQIKSVIKRKSFLDEAVKGCGDDYLVIYYYAYNFERRRKYDRALYFYTSAITLNPDYARSYFGLGDTYLALHNNKKAVAAFEKGLQLEPGNTWAEKSLKKARERLPMQVEDHFDAGSAPRVNIQEKAETATLAGPVKQPLSSAVATHFGKPAEEVVAVTPELPASAKQTGARLEEEKDLTARDFIEHMQVDSATGPGAQVGVLQMQIQFTSSSGDLTSQAMEKLDSVVCKALLSDELKESSFEVAGHTDASGNFELNMHISRMRAHAVKQYLVDRCGVEPDRISIVYYGETRPMVPNTSRENRRLNRRVEFRKIIGKDQTMHRQ